MEATLNQRTTLSSTDNYAGDVRGTLGGTLVAVAAIAAGVFYLLDTNVQRQEEEMDTTEYLLSGGNRKYVLAALERRRAGNYVVDNRTL